MATRFNTAVRNALATAGVASLTVLEIRTGAQPASANDAASGTLLATVTVAWGTAANGVVSITGTPSATAVASGTAGHGRFRNTGDTLRMDGAAGAEFTLNSNDIVSGGTVTVTSGTLTQPSGE
jgi:hypothetical protein